MSDLLKSNVTVAVGTALSRVTGLLRVVVFGAVIGRDRPRRRLQARQRDPEHRLRAAARRRAVGDARAAVLRVRRDRRRGGDQRRDHRRRSCCWPPSPRSPCSPRPFIFRLYTLSPADGVDADLFRQVGTMLDADLPRPDLLLRLDRARPARSSTAAAGSSPRRGARSCPTSSSSRRCCRCPTPGDAGWQLSDVISDDRLRWTLGLGATAGIATMALALVVAAVPHRIPLSTRSGTGATRPSSGCSGCRCGRSATSRPTRWR